MQAWPPQQGDKLWVLRLKRQSILGESYYLSPKNTTNKVLKALKTERRTVTGRLEAAQQEKFMNPFLTKPPTRHQLSERQRILILT